MMNTKTDIYLEHRHQKSHEPGSGSTLREECSPDEEKQHGWGTEVGPSPMVITDRSNDEKPAHLIHVLRGERYIRHSAGIVITKLHGISALCYRKGVVRKRDSLVRRDGDTHYTRVE